LKDADFYDLFLTSDIHPKVIYFRFGNLTLNEMHQYFQKFWFAIIGYLDDASFIIAQEDKVFILH
jgi:predicted nuclease of predicted toxin-antitoxin system